MGQTSMDAGAVTATDCTSDNDPENVTPEKVAEYRAEEQQELSSELQSGSDMPSDMADKLAEQTVASADDALVIKTGKAFDTGHKQML